MQPKNNDAQDEWLDAWNELLVILWPETFRGDPFELIDPRERLPLTRFRPAPRDLARFQREFIVGVEIRDRNSLLRAAERLGRSVLRELRREVEREMKAKDTWRPPEVPQSDRGVTELSAKSEAGVDARRKQEALQRVVGLLIKGRRLAAWDDAYQWWVRNSAS